MLFFRLPLDFFPSGSQWELLSSFAGPRFLFLIPGQLRFLQDHATVFYEKE